MTKLHPPHRLNSGVKALLLALPLALACAGNGYAADGKANDDARLRQSREQTRQAQQAAQQAQQEKATVLREKEALQKTVTEQTGAREKAEDALRRKARELAALATAKEALQVSLDTEKAERAKLQEQFTALQAQWQSSQELLQDQRRVTASVSALLQRSVAALNKSEAVSQQLYEMGMDAVHAYENRTPEAMRAHDDRLWGLHAVTLHSEGDAMRRAMDEALRGNTVPAANAVAPAPAAPAVAAPASAAPAGKP